MRWASGLRHRDRTSSLLAELKECSSSKNLATLKQIHQVAVDCGEISKPCIANTLISTYGKCGRLSEAHTVFDSMKQPNVVSWNALVWGYADNGESATALHLFVEMRHHESNARSFVAALKACSCSAADAEGNDKLVFREMGQVLHLLASRSGFDSDTYVGNMLVDMYSKCSSMELSWRVFNAMSHSDVVAWTSLIMGYADNGESLTALDLFVQMRCLPNERTFLAALKACSDLSEFDRVAYRKVGKVLHLLASTSGCDSNTYVENTLVDMYSKTGNIQRAFQMFQDMRQHTLVSWNAVIAGYVDNGQSEMALNLFSKLRESFTPDSKSFIAALKACIELANEHETVARRIGKALHLLISTSCSDASVYLENTLIDMYVKLGNMAVARRLFGRMQNATVVSWTALILGYADKREGEACLYLFGQMELDGFAPDARTLVAAIKGCTEVTVDEHVNKEVELLRRGRAIHLLASTSGFDADMYVGNTLVDMYAKCGSMADARTVFEGMLYHDIVSWNALILGYVENREAKVVLEMFERMKHEGNEPNAVTLVAAVKACGVLGALEFGNALHGEIRRSGDLEHNADLASSLVEFYAKCGNLFQAEQVFKLQERRDTASWNALLTGYSRHGPTAVVFHLFDKMLDAGLKPDGITFSCILTACSHSGLVERAQACFQSMPTKHGVRPDVEHYTCMIDILGRANKLDSAMALLRGMLCSPDAVTWMTILGACRKWKSVELGKLAFESLTRLDDRCSGAYVLMANT